MAVVEERYRPLPCYRENVNFPTPAWCAPPQPGREQTIGFAGFGILPTVRLGPCGSLRQLKVGHSVKDIARPRLFRLRDGGADLDA